MTAVRRVKRAIVALLPHAVSYRLRRYLHRRDRMAPDYDQHAFAHRQQPLDAADPLSQAFHARGPWYTQFSIKGRLYGGTNSYEGDIRLTDYVAWVKPAGRVLELGSFEGAHSLFIAQQPGISALLGLEGRDFLIARAEFVRQVVGQANVSFQRRDFEIDRLTQFGRFDSVFCSGLLYHLSHPWRLLKQISRVTNHLFLSTHYVLAADELRGGYTGKVRAEYGYAEPLSGLHSSSFWLTLDSLRLALHDVGFTVVSERVIPEWPNGPVINLYARKSPS